ncbi:hypothetical protein [Vibrio vulnificus]|uniref:hypothetical protein n=1 Tax=Vibrio vulnificus TaxID=672 RepID=UPI000A38125B|nr:hypothetical protein [Vibrio vulnificus]EHU5129631.1 hypothetical protein [Vibrio vulnificus]EHW0628569.1 hypothetical protein [Vibrio vulnificus]OUD79051.1 putative membrane protein [Vibrio vulnificus]
MIEDVPSFLTAITTWLISEGVWFFPLILLVTNFALKCYINNVPDKADICQSIVAVPAEIKVVASSFVFAAAIASTNKPSEAFALQIVGIIYLIILAVSIGFFNKYDGSEARSIEGSIFTYLVISSAAALVMLGLSIQLMMHTVS